MKLIGILLLCASAFAKQPPAGKPDRVITIVAERFTFNPAKVTVKQGELIEFVLTSDDTDHGFRIVGTNVNVTIPKRGKGIATVIFQPPAAGKYVFECSKLCGAGHEFMRGQIIAE